MSSATIKSACIILVLNGGRYASVLWLEKIRAEG